MKNVLPLNIHNVHVKTADVQLKVLTVGGKQVTLAVFRQLLRQPLITYEGDLAGIPWGVVNYHPDKCEGGRSHYHVVWQIGDQLRRDNILAEPSFFDEEGPLLEAAFPWVRARIRNWMWGGDAVEVSGTNYAGMLVHTVVSGIRLHVPLDELEAAVVAIFQRSHIVNTYYTDTDKIEEFHWATDGQPGLEAARQRLIAAGMKEAARRRKVLETTAGIAALPQLFIAL